MSTSAIARTLAAVVMTWTLSLHAQQGGAPGRGQPPANDPRTAGAFDPAGYWVSIVSDEWRYRMITPPKGNVDYVPINAEGRRVADAWDPEKDEANGEQCKGYGAGGIMRLPARLHFTWQDARTLTLEIDTGTQTRVFRFGGTAPSSVESTWQGYSIAEWQFGGPRGFPGIAPAGPPGQRRPGQLKVVTTHMRPGYVRKNGVPYGANAVLTEYFARLQDDDGAEYLAVTTMLEDPQYLAQPWVRTSQFRKQADAKGWNPTPCVPR